MNEKLVSFAATIAYGWLSLALLVIAALWMGSPYAVMCGLLACGAAYIAQLIYTQPEGIWEVRIGAAFQILSLALWLTGLFLLCRIRPMFMSSPKPPKVERSAPPPMPLPAHPEQDRAKPP